MSRAARQIATTDAAIMVMPVVLPTPAQRIASVVKDVAGGIHSIGDLLMINGSRRWIYEAIKTGALIERNGLVYTPAQIQRLQNCSNGQSANGRTIIYTKEKSLPAVGASSDRTAGHAANYHDEIESEIKRLVGSNDPALRAAGYELRESFGIGEEWLLDDVVELVEGVEVTGGVDMGSLIEGEMMETEIAQEQPVWPVIRNLKLRNGNRAQHDQYLFYTGHEFDVRVAREELAAMGIDSIAKKNGHTDGNNWKLVIPFEEQLDLILSELV